MIPVGEYSLIEPSVEIRNSEPGGFTGQIALSQKKRSSLTQGITRDEFRPWNTNYQIFRGGQIISAGIMTSLNFSKDRDTALVGGKDWLYYLQRRVYPFDPELYVSGGWVQWPRRWPDVRGVYGPRDYINNPTMSQIQGATVDIQIILRELIQSMRFDPPAVISNPANYPRSSQWPAGASQTAGVPQITQNIAPFNEDTKYQIYPGDQTTIFEHITKISEQSDKGFEFDILPLSLEFKVYNPRRNQGQELPLMMITPTMFEIDGAITEFDWTNEGPDGTYLVGLGSGRHKTGAVWTDVDNVAEFQRTDKVYDFGEVQHPNLILQMLKDQNDLHPQKKLRLEIVNPENLLLSFYTSGRPRELIGAKIRVAFDFAPLHLVDAEFRINAIQWRMDGSTNEFVNLELEMVYDP